MMTARNADGQGGSGSRIGKLQLTSCVCGQASLFRGGQEMEAALELCIHSGRSRQNH